MVGATVANGPLLLTSTGPARPPSSPTEKKMLAAEPMERGPIADNSINVFIIKGISAPAQAPSSPISTRYRGGRVRIIHGRRADAGCP